MSKETDALRAELELRERLDAAEVVLADAVAECRATGNDRKAVQARRQAVRDRDAARSAIRLLKSPDGEMVITVGGN
jgi:hypothetical protein